MHTDEKCFTFLPRIKSTKPIKGAWYNKENLHLVRKNFHRSRDNCNGNGRMEKIVVDRYYATGHEKPVLAKFTGAMSVAKEFHGLKIGTVYDGIWDFQNEQYHYVHFIINKIEYE